MKSLIAALVTVVVLVVPASAVADPGSPDKGCHGYYTTQYKESVGDRGGQGSAIGGLGNSDGDATNGQAHSADGRGVTLQEFLATTCGVGSQAD
jgi:hypothetical protein